MESPLHPKFSVFGYFSGHPSSCQCDSQSTETGSPIKGGIMNRKNMVHIHHGKAICFTKRQVGSASPGCQTTPRDRGCFSVLSALVSCHCFCFFSFPQRTNHLCACFCHCMGLHIPGIARQLLPLARALLSLDSNCVFPMASPFPVYTPSVLHKRHIFMHHYL